MSERSERIIGAGSERSERIIGAGSERSDRDAIADVVTGYLTAFAGGDPDRIASYVSEDFINEHSSALGSSLVGRDNYRQRLPIFLSRFIGLRYDIEDLVIEGERAVAAYRMSFTYRDDEGREWPVSLPGVFRFTVSGGRITSRVDYWDGINFQNQTSLRSPATQAAPGRSLQAGRRGSAAGASSLAPDERTDEQ